MKQLLLLMKQYFTKEKIIILLIIFGLLVISMFYTYNTSVYCQGYMSAYKDAPLEFFYYIQSNGINPFVFMILMLLLPNIVSYDLLSMQQNHTTYLMETRIGKRKFYLYTYFINYILSASAILVLEIGMLIVIHLFLGKIQFNMTIFPEAYYPLTQTICKDEFTNLIYFLILTSMGYALLSSVIFSLQVFIPHIYLYRCSGVIVGICLVVFPILLMGYFPIEDFMVLFQITPLAAIGVEVVRKNPFGFSNIMYYFAVYALYTFISIILYKILYKWRNRND